MWDDSAFRPVPYRHVLHVCSARSLSRADPFVLLRRGWELDAHDVGTPFADHLTYFMHFTHRSGQRDSNPRSPAWKASDQFPTAVYRKLARRLVQRAPIFCRPSHRPRSAGCRAVKAASPRSAERGAGRSAERSEARRALTARLGARATLRGGGAARQRDADNSGKPRQGTP